MAKKTLINNLLFIIQGTNELKIMRVSDQNRRHRPPGCLTF